MGALSHKFLIAPCGETTERIEKVRGQNLQKLRKGSVSSGVKFPPKLEIFAILSYLSRHIYTHNVAILLNRTDLLGMPQQHKISSESLNGLASIALPRGGDAY